MMLVTKEIAKKLPPLYSHENDPPEKTPIPLKLFTPWARWTWYITEYDGEDIAFGYCLSGLDPNFDELGYVSLKELMELTGPLGLKVERDAWWDGKTTLDKVMKGTVH